MRFDERYEETVTLRDGQQARLRLIRPDDREGLREGFERLGPESRYARFLIGKSSLSERELRYLTELDGVNHFAIVAGQLREDGTERGLGVARFVREPDEPHVAEPAVAIADDSQGRGLGGIMLQRLTEAAVERDVWRFRCPVLASNDGIKQVLAEIQPDVHQAPAGDGVTLLEIILPGSQEDLQGPDATVGDRGDPPTPTDQPADQEAHDGAATAEEEPEQPAREGVRVGALRRLLRQVASQAVELEHRWREFTDDEQNDAEPSEAEPDGSSQAAAGAGDEAQATDDRDD